MGGWGEQACLIGEDFLEEVDTRNPPAEKVEQGHLRSRGGLLC